MSLNTEGFFLSQEDKQFLEEWETFCIKISFDLWLEWHVPSEGSFKWDLYHSRVIRSPRVFGEKSGPLVSSAWHLAGTPLPPALADPAGSNLFCNAKISRGTFELATSVSQRNCDAVSTDQCTNTARRQPANLNHNVIMKMMMAFSVGHTCLLWGDSENRGSSEGGKTYKI